MDTVKYSRVNASEVNVLLACTVDVTVRSRVSNWETIKGSRLVINFYDYLTSQVYNNYHKYISDPFRQKNEKPNYSVTTTEFSDARNYIDALCHKTILRADNKVRNSFYKCLKLFITEMILVQTILCQVDTDKETISLITLPRTLIDTLELKPISEDISEVLENVNNVILVRDFDFVYNYIKDNDLIEDALSILTGYNSAILYNLDYHKLLQEVYSNPSSLIKQAIAQLWLVQKNIYAFGGIYDKALETL